MASEPKTWTTGETITAGDLNLITPFVEPFVVDESQNASTLHTAEYIFNALKSGRVGFIRNEDETSNLIVYEFIEDGAGGYYMLTFAYDYMTEKVTTRRYMLRQQAQKNSLLMMVVNKE